MSGMRRVANHFKYLRSNWMIVAAGFLLALATILVAGSLSRAGGNVLATDYYQNGGYSSGYDTDYYENGGYPANGSGYSADYYKNGGYPVSSGSSYDKDYYKNGGYPADDDYGKNGGYSSNDDYYKNGGYPVKNNNGNGCHSGCGHTPYPTYKPQARYSCDRLTVTKISDRQVRLTTRASTSGGAYVLGYRYEYGDGGVQDGPSSVTHTYNRSGTFTARAWVLVKVNGQQKWATSNACTQTFTLKKQNHCPYNSSYRYDDDRYCGPHPKPTPTHTPCACNGHDQDDDDDYDYDHDDEGGYGGGYPSGGNNGNNNQNQNSNTNNNNSSATANAIATANVTVKQAKPASVSTASTVTKSAPSAEKYPVMELPQTGPEDAVIGTIGLGSLVAAGTAYVSSRRELLRMVFKR